MPELIHEYRGGVLENIHRGRICVTDRSGRTVYAVGDPEEITFYRSASKPIQALPLLERGLDGKYGLSGEETAVMSGSHSGEDFHLAAVLGILEKAGYSEDEMIMNPTYPEDAAARNAMIKAGMPPRKALHNCSGKHAGLMLLAGELGDHRDYWRPDCPAQREVKSCIARMSGWPEEKIGVGIDGCGVPVFAVPLRCIAASFVRLGCPELIEDEALRRAAEKMSGAMHAHPLYVKGTGTLCSLLNSDPNIVAKGGAQGVYAMALKREGLGIAIKQEDGTQDERADIIAEVLRQIGYADRALIDRLEQFHPGEIVNDNGTVVGERKTVFFMKKY